MVLGYTPFKAGETYEELRERIKDEFASKRGPGTYYLYACDERKAEIKNIGLPKFDYSEKEIPVPEPPIDPIAPVRDTMSAVKKIAKDAAEMQQLEYTKELLDKFLGKKKEEESVKESPSMSSNLNDFIIWKTFMDDSGKKKDASFDSALQQQLLDLKMERLVTDKIEKSISEVKALLSQLRPEDRFEKIVEKMNESQARILEKVAELGRPREEDKLERVLREITAQNQRMLEKMVDLFKPKEESKVEKLLETLITKQATERSESAIQSMLALMVKQQEDRERTRLEEEKRREMERRDEMKFERERFEKELSEQKRRFEEELKLRREEIKADQEKSRAYATEQQKFQLQLLDIFKNNKDAGLEAASKIVETLTAAGMTSMKTAQEAAETIMEVAKTITPREKKDKEDGKGFVDQVKDIAQIAAPLLAPVIDANAKMQLLQAASKLSAGGLGGASIPKPPQKSLQGITEEDIRAAMAAFADMASKAQGKVSPASQVSDVPAGVPSNMSQSTAVPRSSSFGGVSGMIAQYLKAYPILKHALIGNLRDNLGVKSFLPVVTGLNQPTLEGLLANVPHQVVMNEIKMVCTDDEARLVDMNEEWFVKFRQEMIKVLKEEEEEEEVSSPGSPR